ncbi:unnamed protein product [Adineta ricciae]|uniref:Uncharacterized protein n=1 Tax=Adineta ricciae TaxID=249248 RepID=A0A813RI26_ADIRI|nr:unnamed protein product [Adineta ricciae]CAF1348907.1 unnamed protein product [Adineta ricciae]
MNSSSKSTKTWTLLRYAVEINHHSPSSSPNSTSSSERQQPQRQLIDCSEGLLCLTLTPSQQLYVIRDDTEKIECVDLLTTDSSSVMGTYTGDSLLLTYLIPHDNIQRKFLVKFASTATLNARQHCEDCVKLLSHSINITHFDSTSSSSPITTNSIVSIADMIKYLMKENPIQLSSYYNQEVVFNWKETDELLEKYLCDETFPDFVANVASVLETMKDSSK